MNYNKYICFYLNSEKIRNFPLGLKGINKFYLDSNRNINIKKGIDFVTISGLTYEKFEFNVYGTITNIQLLKESDDGFRTYEVECNIVDELKENNLLYDLLYSLTKVSNYKFPYKHFARNYTYLDEFDYITIINGRIFIARTAFGKILNALQETHLQEFLSILFQRIGMDFFYMRDYLHGLDILKEYINNTIESRGKLLIESEDILRQYFSNQINLDEIGFSADEDKIMDYIVPQANIFRQLFANFNETDIWKMISEEIEMNSIQEYEFNERFLDFDWPINKLKH
jgi:hypothetical protein